MGSAQLTWRGSPLRLFSYTALALLTLFGTLVTAALVPLVFGWSPSVVMSGSMAPSFEPGDVVIAKPVTTGELVPGRVIRFRDPADPNRHLVHRIVDVGADGAIITKGDANSARDDAITEAHVTGSLRLRVPWVGLPRLWAESGEYGRLVALAGGLPLAWSLAWSGRTPPPARSPVTRHRGRHRPA